jgi:hypothetical protein
MTKEKGRQWDGKSRPSDDTYRKRWEEIFGKKKEKPKDISDRMEEEIKNITKDK